MLNNKSVRKFINAFVLSVIAILVLLPFAFILLTSFRTSAGIVRDGPLALPEVWQFYNYIRIWEVGNFPIYYKNSAIIAFFTVILVTALATSCAFSLTFLKVKFKSVFLFGFLLGIIVPTEVFIIPLYHNLRGFGMLNTRWAVILPQVAMQMAFGTYLLKGFMTTIPASMLESARIDGSKEIQNLVYIVIPLVRPAVVSLAIFSAMWSWNNFFLPLILLQRDKMFTVPAGLRLFTTQYTNDYPMISTAALIACVPIIIIYLLFQDKITKGMVAGAVKE